MANTITKTIKLKMVLPKNSSKRRALFDSHCALNEAAYEYEKLFMLMRQEEYYDANRNLISQADVMTEFAQKFPSITTGEQKEAVKAIFTNIAVDGGNGKAPSAQDIGQWNTLLFGTCQKEEGKKGGRKSAKEPTDKTNTNKEVFKTLKANCSKHNIFPLLEPILTNNLVKQKFTQNQLNLSYWDKSAMRVAASHLISWNAVDKSTKDNYAKQMDEVSAQKEKYDTLDENLRAGIEQYCKERKDENAGFETDKEFYITDSMCDGLNDIIKEWKNKDEAGRLQVVTDWQSDEKKKRKIGDVNFFHWLLKENNKTIWQTEDFLKTVRNCHAALSKLERLAPSARYTFPDKINSPRWLMYEYKGGKNLKKYEILCEDNKLKLKLPLLKKNDGGKFDEATYEFDLAKSGQFEVVEVKGKKVKFKTNDEEFGGEFGGADILVKLDGTGKSVKAAYLKIAMKVDKKLPYDDFEKVSNKVNYHFSTAYIQDKTTHSDEILAAVKAQHPIRVMSVDLGQRSFGACSIFQLADKNSVKNDKFIVPVILPDGDWLAVHERSFLAKLPGEDASDKIIANRIKAMDEVKTLQREVDILKDVLKIINQSDLNKKQKLIEQSKKYYENETYKTDLEELSKLTVADVIDTKVQEFFTKYEKTLAEKIKKWRKETKARATRDYYGGKSMWMIEYLTKVRTLLLRWSNHPRKAGQVIRQDKEKFGTVCKKLLTHINNLKADRIKTGADLLIQSARGFVYNDEKHLWDKKFEPCNVIVFEDLRGYKFDTRKTKYENITLMEWAHRKIIVQIKGQAKLYGILIYDSTDAKYTSKFYAKTNAPGIRCKVLKKEDFEEEKLVERLKKCISNDYKEDEVRRLKVGDVIPMEGGELFATLDRGKLKIIHADINASWNLQRRFWSRHTDLLNFRKTYLSSKKLYVKDDAGYKKFNGALKKAGFNPKNTGLVRVSSGVYKITNDKTNTVDGEYSLNLFCDTSGEFYKNQDEFYPKNDFEKVVREKIIVKLKLRHGRS